MSGAERRRSSRLGLAIPIRVQGFLKEGGNWEEIASTDDVSAGGASFTISRSVELGQVLHLSLNLPKRLRQYDLTDASYRVYSLVRGITRKGENNRVGVMFFGKFPPRGFHENPGARAKVPAGELEQYMKGSFAKLRLVMKFCNRPQQIIGFETRSNGLAITGSAS